MGYCANRILQLILPQRVGFAALDDAGSFESCGSTRKLYLPIIGSAQPFYGGNVDDHDLGVTFVLVKYIV